jgi:hypothetical protein
MLVVVCTTCLDESGATSKEEHVSSLGDDTTKEATTRAKEEMMELENFIMVVGKKRFDESSFLLVEGEEVFCLTIGTCSRF